MSSGGRWSRAGNEPLACLPHDRPARSASPPLRGVSILAGRSSQDRCGTRRRAGRRSAYCRGVTDQSESLGTRLAPLTRARGSRPSLFLSRWASNPPNGSEIVVSAFASPGCARRDVRDHLRNYVTRAYRLSSRMRSLLSQEARSEIPRSLPGTRSSSPLFRPPIKHSTSERARALCARYACAFPSNRQPVSRSTYASGRRARGSSATVPNGYFYLRGAIPSDDFARPHVRNFRIFDIPQGVRRPLRSPRSPSITSLALVVLGAEVAESDSTLPPCFFSRLESRAAASIFIAIIAPRISDAHLRNKCHNEHYRFFRKSERFERRRKCVLLRVRVGRIATERCLIAGSE
jgi:hypothetical protein